MLVFAVIIFFAGLYLWHRFISWVDETATVLGTCLSYFALIALILVYVE